MKYAVMICIVICMSIAAYVTISTLSNGDAIRAICQDGSISKSKNARGTCSGHGGVERWVR